MNFTTATQRKAVLHQAAIVLIASFLAVIPFGQLSQVPMVVMAGLGLILLIKQGKTLWEKPEIRLFTQVFAAFWIPVAISLIGAANPEKTLSVTIVFLRFFSAGVFIIFTLTQPGAMAKLLGLNAWILVIWMAQALLQAGFGLNFPGNLAMGMVNGFFRTGSDLSLVLSVCCPFLLVYSRRTWPLLLQALVFTTIVAVVFMAGGRGGWINLIVVLTGFGAWMMYRDRKNIFRIAVAGLLLALTIVGAWHFSHGFSTRLNQSLLVFSKDTALINEALSLRLPIWQTAITVFRHHPVNGVGARNLRYVYADFASPDDHFIRTGLTVAHAHTLILDIGSETGMIGLLGLVSALWLLLAAWHRADLSRRRHILPYALALSAVFFPFNTHYATYSSAWSAVCFWLLALFCATSGGVAGPSGKTILWWGRCDPEYSRNRLLRSLLKQQGWRIKDFYPGISFLGNLEASLRGISKPDLVWVPCFRHRDLLSARRWSAGHKIPLVFDPLISDYDKQVFERNKFAENSPRARAVLKKESRLMQAPDLLLADTSEHARFYRDVLKADPRRLFVLPVGAEEDLFHPDACNAEKFSNCTAGTDLLEVLFYGSFIPLQGPQFIAEAIRVYQGPPVHWVFLGNGPLLHTCQKMTAGLPHVVFESWLPYLQLPDRICRADILLGIFGATPKTRRVIPNKVFQSMACGRPVITAATPAYPESLLESRDSGIIWVEPANPEQLADAVARLAKDPQECHRTGAAAHQSFHRYFSVSHLSAELEKILATISDLRKNS